MHHTTLDMLFFLSFTVIYVAKGSICVEGIIFFSLLIEINIFFPQDEAALRLVNASLGTPEYRPINIFVNFYSSKYIKYTSKNLVYR